MTASMRTLAPDEGWALMEASRADLPVWVGLARAFGGPVLELGSGAGRVAWALSREGFAVTGVELSHERLAKARSIAVPPAATAPSWVECDARQLRLRKRYPLILLPARFLELFEPSDRAPLLRRVADHLAPGGRVALHLSLPPTHDQPERSAARVLRQGWPWRRREVVWQERLHDGSREVSLIRRAWRGGQVDSVETWGPLRLAWVEPDELSSCLAAAGLALAEGGPAAPLLDLARRAVPGSWVALAKEG